MDGLPFADIIILGLIAVFIVLRLRNTLGKEVGHKPDLEDLRNRLEGKPVEEKVVDMQGQPAPAADEKTVKAEAAAREAIGDLGLLAGVDAIAAVDANFSINGFLEGAKGAFEWVLKAYSAGDVDTLKMLLAAPIFEEFNHALEAAKAQNTKTETTLVAIKDAQILAASLEKNIARVTVRFVSDQVEVVRDAEGKIIDGDPSKTEVVEDQWVFERDVKSRNPNWMVMDT
jgi:predicted lipid-binding transport protein (Tim44 family)